MMVKMMRISRKQRKSNKTALVYATDLLALQDYSESRLRQKLVDREYSEDEINDAIEKLKKYKFIDDERACSSRFEMMYNSNRYSTRNICFKLLQLGFDEQLIKSCKPEDYSTHDEIVAEKLLKSKFKTMPDDNKKLWTFLSTKGFDYSIVSSVINKFKNENPSCDS